MSEEKPSPDQPATEEPATSDAAGTKDAPKFSMPPVAALLYVVMALLGVLIVLGVRNGMRSEPTDTDPVLLDLQAEVDARRNELNRQRVSMGYAPLAETSEPITDISKRLKTDTDTLVALAGRFQEMLEEKDMEISAKNSEVLRSEQLRQSLAAESSRLQGELQRALVNGSDADLLRRDLANLKSQRDALVSELGATKEKMQTLTTGVSEADFADLQRRYEETLRAKEFYESRVKALEGDLENSKLFARSENELLPAAVELFRKLRELEGHPDSDLTTAYSNLGVDLGASVLHTLPFATGSAGLAPSDEEMIRNVVDEIPDGDLVLVIGYASETGNEDSNRKLSSDRATVVAELYSSLKRPGQLVQAVYLGQTDRFSSSIPERNQLCEIWRVRKK